MPYKFPNSEAAILSKRRSAQKYYQMNRDNILHNNKTNPVRIRTIRLSNWRRANLVHENMNELYEAYIRSTHCDHCHRRYQSDYHRCLDHCHETGQFRAFLCRGCNSFDNYLHGRNGAPNEPPFELINGDLDENNNVDN